MWPVLVSNLVSIAGVLFFNWKVADLFFWFWFELTLTGVTLVLLATVWACTGTPEQRSQIKVKPMISLFAFAMVLLYATMFFGLAYLGEWERWGRFPEFLDGKGASLLGTAAFYALYLVRTLRQPQHGAGEARQVDLQFARRSGVVLVLYAVLMLHYHFSGAQQLNITPAYLKAMGLILLTAKLMAELGGMDRFFMRRKKAP